MASVGTLAPSHPHTLRATTTVSQHGLGVYENLQPDLYDVANWTLEWLSAISRSNVAKLSDQLVGGY